MPAEITLTRPDDWHIHLRDGDMLHRTVGDVARTFGRAIVMPNLVPPVVTTEQALAYRERILAQRPAGSDFEPLMTLYLTEQTEPAEIHRAAAAGIPAVKLYPAGATTNSASGVRDLERVYPVLEAMEEAGMRFLMHGEVTDPEIDIFDREKAFIDRHLHGVVKRFPGLKMVLEHITTRDAVAFVDSGPETIGATITAHHLLYNRNHMLAGGIRPHYYCLPILKRNLHQQALIEAATGDNPRFFLGTDSAPHPRNKKEAACGCAGSYTAHAALECYAEVFEDAGALERLEAFASHRGADFYGLPRNRDQVRLIKRDWPVPEQLSLDAQPLVPLRAGETLRWQLAE